jgi:hypothetical protein
MAIDMLATVLPTAFRTIQSQTKMTESAESANRFVQDLSALAGRLAAIDVVVSSLHCDWASFGSWKLEVQKGRAADTYGEALLASQWDTAGPEVIRIYWDRRERVLTIENAPTPPLSSPGPWTRQTEQAFGDSETAVRFVEDHLQRWTRGAP